MRPDRLLRREIHHRYLVTTESGETFDGLLIEADDTHIVLADVESVAGTGARLKVDGKLWLPRLNIAYMQQPKA